MQSIAFVTGYNGNRPAGLERFLIELLKAMDVLPEATRVTVYTKKGNGLKEAFVKEKISNIQIQEIGFGKLWKDIGLFLAPKKDMYIFNGPQVPLFFVPKKYSTIVYDFAYRQVKAENFQEKIKNKIMDFVSSLAFRRSQLILSLSETIKREVTEIFGIPSSKIEPIYAGFLDVCKLYKAESLQFDFKDFFLFVSTIKERKNVLGVVKGFAHFKKTDAKGVHLVIAGKYNKDSLYYQEIQQVIETENLSETVHFLGHITDNQLSWLYQNAKALVSPSFVEGFGLPLLEAFVCRLPVITSKNSCQSEIAGEAALLVDPRNDKEIGDTLTFVMNKPESLPQFIEKGLNRVKKFSWEQTAVDLFLKVQKFFHNSI